MNNDALILKFNFLLPKKLFIEAKKLKIDIAKYQTNCCWLKKCLEQLKMSVLRPEITTFNTYMNLCMAEEVADFTMTFCTTMSAREMVSSVQFLMM